MARHWDTLIVGAGPGGLACATLLARAGRTVLVLERQQSVGPKVCAGGITWSGLIRRVPEDLVERGFASQYIVTGRQRICVREPEPIVATIGRPTLGRWMARQAEEAGAEIRTGVRVREIRNSTLTAVTDQDEVLELTGNHLVGADGSASLVRRSLNLPVNKCGIGINYQVDGQASRMEWHLNPVFFGYGYGWIFPHRRSVSIGAYGPRGNMGAARLHRGLVDWARQQGYDLARERGRAALINYDYRGFRFGNVWLVGDAAGLASGLTGEGIYPALVSGEAVARKILDPEYPAAEIGRLVGKQRLHNRVTSLAARSPRLSALLMEGLVLLLRLKVLDFHTLEMAE